MAQSALEKHLRNLKQSKRRPVVAYLSGNIHSDHPMGILRRLYELFGTEDIDVRYFLGTECMNFLEGIRLEQSRYDYQYISLYNYSVFDEIDVLIVGFGTISIYHRDMDIRAFMSRLPRVPCIFLENDSSLEGSIFLMVDNYEGMRKTVEHVITEHGCRKIGFVSGPLHNMEARRRYQAYRDTLEAHGIEVDETLIGFGDFAEHSDEIVEDILAAAGEVPPDAILSANDEMCAGIYRVLKKHGYRVGEDILVTGFDDMEMAPFVDPPLTTIRQDLSLYGDLAVEKTIQILAGEKPLSEYLQPEMIIRRSCGCCGNAGRQSVDETDERSMLVSDISSLRKRQQRTWIGALILRELLIESADTKAFFEKLARELSYLNVSSSLLCLLERPVAVTWEKDSEAEPIMEMPERMFVPMIQIGKMYRVWSLEEALPIGRGDLGSMLSFEEACQTFVFLLFYEKYQYGMLYIRTNPEEIPFFYMLSMEIGTGLRYLQMSLERRAFREKLQKQNDMLQYTSTHDALTGLRNRFGILDEIPAYIKAGKGEKLIALMADLDHLKEINDTFGHPEGDNAIRTAARILLDVTGSGGLVGRTGGDEFMAMLPCREGVEELRSRIEERCAAYNAGSDKPYYVELSVGGSVFTASENRDTQSVFQEADEDLYRDKVLRRHSVLKQERD